MIPLPKQVLDFQLRVLPLEPVTQSLRTDDGQLARPGKPDNAADYKAGEGQGEQ
jgi:hypothetical protein